MDKTTVTCSVREAVDLMKKLNDDDLVVLTVVNKKTHTHEQSKKIRKKKGEELLTRAKLIEYQDNDFFGRFSLFGVNNNQYLIHNILFPQLE